MLMLMIMMILMMMMMTNNDNNNDTDLLFWYQVLTWVSVRESLAASSMRSCTLRYFCRSNDFSRHDSWWSVKAVRALRGFFVFREDEDEVTEVEVEVVTSRPDDRLQSSSGPSSLCVSATGKGRCERWVKHKSESSVQ